MSEIKIWFVANKNGIVILTLRLCCNYVQYIVYNELYAHFVLRKIELNYFISTVIDTDETSQTPKRRVTDRKKKFAAMLDKSRPQKQVVRFKSKGKKADNSLNICTASVNTLWSPVYLDQLANIEYAARITRRLVRLLVYGVAFTPFCGYTCGWLK